MDLLSIVQNSTNEKIIKRIEPQTSTASQSGQYKEYQASYNQVPLYSSLNTKNRDKIYGDFDYTVKDRPEYVDQSEDISNIEKSEIQNGQGVAAYGSDDYSSYYSNIRDNSPLESINLKKDDGVYQRDNRTGLSSDYLAAQKGYRENYPIAPIEERIYPTAEKKAKSKSEKARDIVEAFIDPHTHAYKMADENNWDVKLLGKKVTHINTNLKMLGSFIPNPLMVASGLNSASPLAHDAATAMANLAAGSLSSDHSLGGAYFKQTIPSYPWMMIPAAWQVYRNNPSCYMASMVPSSPSDAINMGVNALAKKITTSNENNFQPRNRDNIIKYQKRVKAVIEKNDKEYDEATEWKAKVTDNANSPSFRGYMDIADFSGRVEKYLDFNIRAAVLPENIISKGGGKTIPEFAAYIEDTSSNGIGAINNAAKPQVKTVYLDRYSEITSFNNLKLTYSQGGEIPTGKYGEIYTRLNAQYPTGFNLKIFETEGLDVRRWMRDYIAYFYNLDTTMQYSNKQNTRDDFEKYSAVTYDIFNINPSVHRSIFTAFYVITLDLRTAPSVKEPSGRIFERHVYYAVPEIDLSLEFSPNDLKTYDLQWQIIGKAPCLKDDHWGDETISIVSHSPQAKKGEQTIKINTDTNFSAGVDAKEQTDTNFTSKMAESGDDRVPVGSSTNSGNDGVKPGGTI